jgi:hypothetical protein
MALALAVRRACSSDATVPLEITFGMSASVVSLSPNASERMSCVAAVAETGGLGYIYVT